jgi:hypothetical protein
LSRRRSTANRPSPTSLPGYYTGTVPELNFGEAAINLSSVDADLGEPCLTFASAWAHSRSSSASEDADLKDYVAPRPIKLLTCRASPHISSAASGSVTSSALRAHRALRHSKLSPSTPVGAPLYDVAHLTGGADPTGAITFKLYGPNDTTCSRPPIFEFDAQAKGEGFYRSGDFTTTATGTYHWVVDYRGDINNLPAGPTPCGDEEETVAVSPATPSLSSQASGLQRRLAAGQVRSFARAAQQIHDTAKLDGGVAPTGTISFTLYGPNDSTCSGGHIFTSDVPVSGNGEYKSASFPPPSAGMYRWVVRYSGDANNDDAGPTACGDETETVTISPAQPMISTVASSSVPQGGAISDTATLSGGADPTGTLTFDAYGPDDESCAGTPADSSTVAVTGHGDYVSRDFTPSAPGTYRWVAHYSGDVNNSPVGTGCRDSGEAVVVTPVAPPTQPTLSSVASPMGAPAGSAVHDKAELSNGSDPTGTITFRLYGPNDETCSGAAIFTSSAVVSGNGAYASASFPGTAVGTYHWVVSYSGDDHNRPAGPTACGEVGENVIISPANPAITTTASAGVTARRQRL